jgi:hypothetical protein
MMGLSLKSLSRKYHQQEPTDYSLCFVSFHFNAHRSFKEKKEPTDYLEFSLTLYVPGLERKFRLFSKSGALKLNFRTNCGLFLETGTGNRKSAGVGICLLKAEYAPHM